MPDDPRDPRVERKSVNQTLDRLASGFDAFLTQQRAIQGEQQATQREIATALTMITRMMGDSATVGGGSSLMPLASGADASGYVGSLSAARPGLEVRNTAQEAAQRARLFDYQLDAGRPLGPQTRTNLRQNVFRSALNKAQDMDSQYAEMQSMLGSPETGRYTLDEGVGMNTYGRLYDKATGHYLNAEDAAAAVTEQFTPKDEARAGRRLMQAQTVSRVAQQWSEGSGVGRALMSALPQGALKAAGIAGAVLYGGDKIIDNIQSQAAQNRQYQSVYGGDLGDQWDDRAQQWFNKNVRGRFSMLGGGNYDELFKAGMDLGLRGGDRNEFISTGADIMGRTGASSQFTTGIMRQSIEAGLGLNGLADSIKNVSEAAKDAGINANRAREVFQKNYEAGAQIMFGSQGAKAFAEYATVGQLSMGRTFQGINQVGAFQDPSMISALASRAGLMPTEYLVQARQAPAAALAGGESMIRERAALLTSQTGGPPIQEVVNTYLAELAARGETYRADNQQMIVLGQRLEEAGYLPWTANQLLQSLGVQGQTEATALGYIGNLFTNQSPGQVALNAAQQRTTDLTTRPFDTRKATGGIGSDTMMATNLPFDLRPLSGAVGTGGYMDPLQEQYYRTITGKQQGGISAQDLAGKNRRPILEQLASMGLKGSKTKVKVLTGDGEKVVTLEEAFRDFPDQLENGTAVFMEGVDENMLGQTTSEALGVPTDITTNIKTTSNTKKIDYGKDYDDYLKDQEDKKNKDGDGTPTNVKIDLSDDAKRLLTVMDQQWYSGSATPQPVH